MDLNEEEITNTMIQMLWEKMNGTQEKTNLESKDRKLKEILQKYPEAPDVNNLLTKINITQNILKRTIFAILLKANLKELNLKMKTRHREIESDVSIDCAYMSETARAPILVRLYC